MKVCIYLQYIQPIYIVTFSRIFDCCVCLIVAFVWCANIFTSIVALLHGLSENLESGYESAL